MKMHCSDLYIQKIKLVTLSLTIKKALKLIVRSKQKSLFDDKICQLLQNEVYNKYVQYINQRIIIKILMKVNSLPIQIALDQIKSQKKRLEAQISAVFEEIKKKIYKQIEKAEKKYISSIHDAINISQSYILKQTADDQVDQHHYCFRKVAKFITSLEHINIADISKELEIILKNTSEKLKNIKCQKVKPIQQQNHIVLKNTIHSSDKIHKILFANGQLIQFKQGAIICENNCVNIKYDISTATIITFPNKLKQYIACLDERQLKLMNNKLNLIGIKSNLPFKDIFRVMQMGQYLYAIQRQAVHRMDLTNLNNIKTQVFNKKIIDCYVNDFTKSLVVVCAGYTYYVNEELEIYYQAEKNREILHKKFFGEKVFMISPNIVYIQQNFTLISQLVIDNIINILKVNEKTFLAISGNGNCSLLIESQKDGIQKFQSHRYSKQHTAKIKQVVIGEDLIYCLSESEKKIYIYEFC